MKRSIFLVAACAAAMIASLTTAAIASGPRIALTPSTVRRGHVVRVHGTLTGCAPGDAVTLISRAFPRRQTFAGVPAISATLGATGAYSVTVRVPHNRRPGSYTVSGRCGGGNFGSVTLRVHR